MSKRPEKKIVQVGDSDAGFYKTSGYVSCYHGINLSRADKLCIECAKDTGYNLCHSDFTAWLADPETAEELLRMITNGVKWRPYKNSTYGMEKVCENIATAIQAWLVGKEE